MKSTSKSIESIEVIEESSVVRVVKNPIDRLVEKDLLDEMSDSVWRARLVLAALADCHAPTPDVYPTPEGYVHFEWQQGYKSVLLVFLNDGSVELETNDIMSVTTTNSYFLSGFSSTDLAEITVEALKHV